MDGKLVICPTPLGNLGDMTERALAALRAADVVCAEDTRVTGRVLAAYGIEKRLERLGEALIGERGAGIVQRVLDGETVAYCSDAGMPGVSDPGLRLVRAAREAGAAVEVLPGPTAAATAYVASGCDNPRFYFGGFFPRKDAERAALLDGLRALDAALVFYESPNRLASALAALAAALPQREAAVCRELTKLHEEVVRGPLPELRDEFAERTGAGGRGVKGEADRHRGGRAERRRERGRRRGRAAGRRRARRRAVKAAGARNRTSPARWPTRFGIAQRGV